jgi:hypothetical protein
MTFLSPALLWSFLALIPLAAIYFLKVRPRKKPTTAYFLWERIFQEKRASSLFHRLRDAWSLILMALAAAAICLALGRPEWADVRKDLLIVIDNSASMSARDVGTSRLDLAKRQASDVVQGLNGNQRAAVATVGQKLHYLSHLTDNPRQLLKAIDTIEPSAETLDLASLPAADWDESPQRVAGVERQRAPSGPVAVGSVEPRPQPPGKNQHRVLLVSDGGFDAKKLPAHVEVIKVGAALDNVGLVAADMAFLAGDTGRLGIYFQVASTFAEPQKVDLTLWSVADDGHEQLHKVIPLTIKSGANQPETFELAGASPGRWLARLDIDDALADDNTAYLMVAKPDPIRVKVESPDPFFLENSVQAFARGEQLLTLVKEGAAVVLAKAAAPKTELAIIFQPTGESDWWTKLGDEVEAGAARVLIEGHPVLRHLDATSIPFVGARQITPAAGAQILVTDDSGLPLIYKARHGNRTAVVVNIDPVAAEFYFSAWFPVLVHSAVTHLAGRENPLAAAYRPGVAVPIPAGRDDVVTKITAPQQTKTDSPVAKLETTGAWFRGIDKLGFYKLENSAGKYTIGASLFSPAESLLNNDEVAERHEAISRGRSPAAWLTLLAIVALAAESILYHRRKVG